MRHRLLSNGPVAALTPQTEAAEKLADDALSVVNSLNAQSMYHSPDIRTAYARVRQLTHLASDAAEHLGAAEDILLSAQAGLPVELGDGFIAVVSEKEARQEAGRRMALVFELTALGATDAVASAELYVADRAKRGYLPNHQAAVLSPTQRDTLLAVARGYVTISDGRANQRSHRVSISTIRSLETRGLVARQECARWLVDERVHLTPAGCLDLAASFAQPRAAALATTRSAVPRPTASASTGRTR
ncbi:hypothetical protein [Streptomyces sp. NPDC002790]|uniref:hypothetical protein n=1 Tax=Streptomyces sp. NPDC002790 TaxID=3154431 RepID=UPI00331F97D5